MPTSEECIVLRWLVKSSHIYDMMQRFPDPDAAKTLRPLTGCLCTCRVFCSKFLRTQASWLIAVLLWSFLSPD